jgi:hypothetical protein
MKRDRQLLSVDLNCICKLVTDSRDDVAAKSGSKLPTI